MSNLLRSACCCSEATCFNAETIAALVACYGNVPQSIAISGESAFTRLQMQDCFSLQPPCSSLLKDDVSVVARFSGVLTPQITTTSPFCKYVGMVSMISESRTMSTFYPPCPTDPQDSVCIGTYEVSSRASATITVFGTFEKIFNGSTLLGYGWKITGASAVAASSTYSLVRTGCQCPDGTGYCASSGSTTERPASLCARFEPCSTKLLVSSNATCNRVIVASTSLPLVSSSNHSPPCRMESTVASINVDIVATA